LVSIFEAARGARQKFRGALQTPNAIEKIKIMKQLDPTCEKAAHSDHKKPQPNAPDTQAPLDIESNGTLTVRC
jgi:hypothetical protein